ncbi:MAG: hypothetical protein CSA83_00440 [Actinomycetales bacterium]|nr:MAG: hypothetical protein CSA83_00440 [Actinomycetales bacterium]
MPNSTRTKQFFKKLLFLCALAAIAIAVIFGVQRISDRYQIIWPAAAKCSAKVNNYETSITPAQAEMASIIVAESQRRRLPPRAASIALATAFQESGMRNIDHGDRDSVGLFQQRPSQGWGTVEQLTDPWYSSGKFYERLVTIPNWQTSDLNDIAQKVQISAHPQAYRKHVAKSRTLASALTGETPAAFGCNSSAEIARIDTAADFLKRTFGNRITITRSANTLQLHGESQLIWSAAQLSIANSSITGLKSVKAEYASWNSSAFKWSGAKAPTKSAVLYFQK